MYTYSLQPFNRAFASTLGTLHSGCKTHQRRCHVAHTLPVVSDQRRKLIDPTEKHQDLCRNYAIYSSVKAHTWQDSRTVPNGRPQAVPFPTRDASPCSDSDPSRVLPTWQKACHNRRSADAEGPEDERRPRKEGCPVGAVRAGEEREKARKGDGSEPHGERLGPQEGALHSALLSVADVAGLDAA